jgi:predicted DNA binding protein
MNNNSTTKLVARLARLDNEVETIKAKLTAKLDQRDAVVQELIRWGTEQRDTANAVASVTQGLNWAATGRTLTEDQVRAIRAAYKAGQSQTSLAKQYGLSQPSVHKIVHRQSYADVA